MAYKLLAACLYAKDANGKLHQHLPGGGPGATRGTIIPWLNDQQRAHFLRLKLVEEIGPDHPLAAQAAALAGQSAFDSAPAPSIPVGAVTRYDDDNPVEGGVSAPSDLVASCIADLDRIGVDSQASNPTARDALRGANVSYGNEAIAAAVRYRKQRSA